MLEEGCSRRRRRMLKVLEQLLKREFCDRGFEKLGTS